MEGFVHLKNGQTFRGEWISKPAEGVTGEIVFYTGMTGYQEVLTDPSYKDQIIVFTYPLIGNYGINEEDFESKKPHVAGVIVYEINDSTYHYKAKHSLKEYLEKWGIPLLGHFDTRAIVKQIRSQGSMPAMLSTNECPVISHVESLEAASKVSMVSQTGYEQFGHGKNHIVLIDYGKKKSILSSLLKKDCAVTVVPFNTPFKEIMKLKPDGVLLSNGPGDPKELQNILPTVKKIVTNFPTLGICLGHQLTALALGADTKKLRFGHRGANHPIQDKKKNYIFMSSQNHSYVVDEASLKGTGLVGRFFNLHDQSIEGLTHQSLPVQTVQFHPEAHPGPAEGEYIIDEFIEMVQENNGSEIAYA